MKPLRIREVEVHFGSISDAILSSERCWHSPRALKEIRHKTLVFSFQPTRNYKEL